MLKATFDYVGRDNVVSRRVVLFDGKLHRSKGGADYFKGETLSVDGQPPKHPYSTYDQSRVVDASMTLERVD